MKYRVILPRSVQKKLDRLPDHFWKTELEDRFYWHVRIVADKAEFYIDTKAGYEALGVTRYVLK